MGTGVRKHDETSERLLTNKRMALHMRYQINLGASSFPFSVRLKHEKSKFKIYGELAKPMTDAAGLARGTPYQRI